MIKAKNQLKQIHENDKADIDEEGKSTVLALEGCRLLVTLVIDILCTVFVWSGKLGSGYATAAIVFKDWVTSIVLERQKGRQLVSDLFRDVFCVCDIVVSVALSFYEAQMSLNAESGVGFPVKVAIAVGCALLLPVWCCFMFLTLALLGENSSALIDVFAVCTLFLSTTFQVVAWSLAAAVCGGVNSVELALIAVAFNKLSIFLSGTPEDNTPIKWAKGALFAFATGIQVILMNAPLDTPDSSECKAKCPLQFCRIGVSIISNVENSYRSSGSNAWPTKTNLPTDRVSGWLILDKEDSCAHELLLSSTQIDLFKAWTVIMSLSGILIILMLMHTFDELSNKDSAADEAKDLAENLSAQAGFAA
jgi:hypothetical protein